MPLQPRKKLVVAVSATLVALAAAAVVVRGGARSGPRAAVSGATSGGPEAPLEAASGDVRVTLATPRSEVQARAAAALENEKEGVLARCPAARAGRRTIVVEATFDARGAMVVRRLTPQKGEPDDEVIGCVAAALPRLAIAPPGSNTRVVVDWTLP